MIGKRDFDPKASGYVEVADRIAEFRTKHPEGALQAEVLSWPSTDFPFVVVRASAYRSPTDLMPGIGHAQEPYPGRTPYTKDSELQNAETSAWGRAIVAALAADTKRGIASAEEIRNREATADPPKPRAAKKASGEGSTAAGGHEDAMAPAEPSEPPPDSIPADEGAGDGPAAAADIEAATADDITTLAERIGWNDGKLLKFARQHVGKHIVRPNWSALSPEDAAKFADALRKEVGG